MSTQNSQRKVMVVDDEPQVLKAIRDTLEDQFEVYVETSPLSAIRVLHERPNLSVILSDQRMPGMSGSEFLTKARELSDATRLMITGYADLEAVIRAVNNGHIFGYISKPWNPDALRIAIIKATEHHELTRKLSEEQRLLHNLMDNIPDSVFFKDRELRYIRMNRAIARRFGLASPDEAIGRRVGEFVPAARAAQVESEDTRLFETGVPIIDKLVAVGQENGRLQWYSTTKAPVRNERGEIASLVGVMRDVTERVHMQEALAEREAALRHAQGLARIGHFMWRVDRDEISNVSDTVSSILGVPPESVPKSLEAWMEFVHPGDRDVLRTMFGGMSAADRAPRVEYRLVRGDGELAFVSQVADPGILGTDGKVSYWFVTVQDVSERKRQEEKIARLTRIHRVLSGINSLIVRVRDEDNLFREACRLAVEHGGFRMAWIGIFDPGTGHLRPAAIAGAEDGYLSGIETAGSGAVSEGEGVTLRIRKHKHPIVCNDIEREWTESAARVQALQRGYRSTARLPLVVREEQSGILTLYSGQTGFFDSEEMKLLEEMAGDISFALDHIEKERRANYLAYYDALTELPNRQLFFDRLEQRVVASRRDQTTFTVVMLDVERFRLINETLGRQAGDELLRQLARRLEGELHETAILGRLAADRFGIVTRRGPEVVDVAHMLEKVLSSIQRQPFEVGGRELRVGARAAVASFPADGEDAEVLFSNVEAALRDGKKTGEALRFYAPQMNARVAERLNLENRLRQAVEHEEFVLHYQPKFSLDTGRISGVEALIRWAERNGNLIAPAVFIPVLEETGMILEVGRWVIKKALVDLGRWRAAGIGELRMAVNVSPVQLRREGFVAEVLEATEKAEAHASALELEITESLVMEDIEQNIAKLKAIRELGATVSIDDFGTGYSSLSYIAKLPINALKIDRSFVVSIADNPDSLSIVQSIISLAHSLKLNVVAEGVDSAEQEKLLRLLRCDEVQGFLFGKPLPAEATLDLLRNQSKETS